MVRMSLIIEQVKIIFSMYRAGEISLRTPSMLRAGYQTLLTGGGGVRFVQAQNQQVFKTVCLYNGLKTESHNQLIKKMIFTIFTTYKCRIEYNPRNIYCRRHGPGYLLN